MENIPKPDPKGTTGSQVASSADYITSIEPPPFQHVHNVLEGLAENKFKALGGEATAKIIAALQSQNFHEIAKLQKENSRLKEKIEDCNREYYDCREQAAVYKNQLDSINKLRKKSNLEATFGTALIGISIELYRTPELNSSIAVILALVGATLLIASWFSGVGGKSDS
ncbi:hypothetical protein AB4323_21320 [Vibrio sp. 10N.261.52.C11]|uniref:hypothetical protein n=1 Tax=Vibrio TaxID=662 RepID=UPI0024692A1B|nr:hypothetical protein [Vibrio splendidus]MDH5979758.1 hypothetical protein [Vibrio splendidus]